MEGADGCDSVADVQEPVDGVCGGREEDVEEGRDVEWGWLSDGYSQCDTGDSMDQVVRLEHDCDRVEDSSPVHARF